MKKSIFGLFIAALCFSCGISSTRGQAQDKAAREQLDDRTHEVNKMAKKEAADLVLKRISTETGVPLEQVQAMDKKHGNVGAGGLLLACVLANETKKAPEDFLKQKVSGKSWAAIARDNSVAFEKLTLRLERLEKAIGNDQESKKKERKSK
jgi:hypothetical protein